MIKYEKKGPVAVVTLDRPKARNALCDQLMNELNSVLIEFDKDEEIGAIIITGSKQAFAGLHFDFFLIFLQLELISRRWLLNLTWILLMEGCFHNGKALITLESQSLPL
jgi:hypothetical protein